MNLKEEYAYKREAYWSDRAGARWKARVGLVLGLGLEVGEEGFEVGVMEMGLVMVGWVVLRQG